MAKAVVQAQWRGFVKAIVIACVMAGIGMWSLGWLDKDIATVTGDLLRGARAFLGVEDSVSNAPAPERPELYYSTDESPASVPDVGGINSGATGVDAITQEHSGRGAIVGRVSVIDGDTLELRGKRVRLWGIDAPESLQMCSKDGRPWRCGTDAANALSERINNQLVACYDKGLDRYNRMLGQCFIGQIDLNGWLVRQGWAFSYRQATNMYTSRESMAKFQRIGIWRDGGVEAPWEWRKAHPRASTIN